MGLSNRDGRSLSKEQQARYRASMEGRVYVPEGMSAYTSPTKFFRSNKRLLPHIEESILESLPELQSDWARDISLVKEVCTRLVVCDRSDKHYAVWDEILGCYQEGFLPKTFMLGLAQHCPILSYPFVNIGRTKKRRSAAEVLELTGYSVRHVLYRYGQECGELTLAGDTVLLPAAKWAALTPARNVYVEDWLNALGAEQPDMFTEWLATFRNRDRPATALYLWGAPGSGKQLLAQGLAQLYQSRTCALWQQAIQHDRDQDILLQTGLVVVDERMPGYAGSIPTDILRRVITDHNRQVQTASGGSVALEGTIRLLVTSNSPDTLTTEEQMSTDDMRALMQRILALRVTNKAEKILLAYGQERRDSFVKDAILARHVLWMEQEWQLRKAEQSSPDAESRFLAEHPEFDNIAKIATVDGEAKNVLKAIVEWVLKTPPLLDGVPDDPEYLMVCPSTLSRLWEDLLPTVRTYSTALISSKLRNMCQANPVLAERYGNNIKMAYRVPWLVVLRSAGWVGCGADVALAMAQKAGKLRLV